MDSSVRQALLLVDFINLFDFPDSGEVARASVVAARNAAHLKALCRSAQVPCIYANDNFGHWESEFSALVERCLHQGGPSREIAEVLRPAKGNLSVLKPRHSAFYGTPLEFLLEELHVESLIVCGVSADMCVFATAQDAHTRKFELWVPSDCVAADTDEHAQVALEQMRRTLGADTRPAGTLRSLEPRAGKARR